MDLLATATSPALSAVVVRVGAMFHSADCGDIEAVKVILEDCSAVRIVRGEQSLRTSCHTFHAGAVLPGASLEAGGGVMRTMRVICCGQVGRRWCWGVGLAVRGLRGGVLVGYMRRVSGVLCVCVGARKVRARGCTCGCVRCEVIAVAELILGHGFDVPACGGGRGCC